MKSALQRIIPITVLLILWVSSYTFAETTAAVQPDSPAASSKTTELSPKDAMVYYNRGNANSKLGNYTQAISDYNLAIELSPNNATLYFNRGIAYSRLENNEQAIRDFDKAIELNPQDAMAYNHRGAAYDGLGNYSQAIADYDKAIALHKQDATVSDNGDGQSDWMAHYTKVIEEHKLWGMVSVIVILVAVFVLFFVISRKKSFSCMQDDEMIALIKEAAQEGQFDRISRKEMKYIYHRGFALATHRLDDDDLIKAVNQFKAGIEKRKEAPSPQLPSGEKTSLSSCLEEAHDVDESLYEAILGEKNCIYYLTKFKYFDWEPILLQESWNWAAFFGTGIWWLYRKMYGWFLAFLGIAALSAACVLKGEYILGLIVFIVPWIAFTVYANSLYHNRVKKIIAAAQLSITDKSKLIEYLRYEGGVNIWVVWVSVLLPVAGMVAAILFYMVRR